MNIPIYIAMKRFLLLFIFSILIQFKGLAQTPETAGPVFIDSSTVSIAGPLSQQELKELKEEPGEKNPKYTFGISVVPGKGSKGYIAEKLQTKMGTFQNQGPSLVFEAANVSFNPSDPTGAVGPNHYVNAFNEGFAIWDKQGNLLVPHSALSSIGGEFEPNEDGDPIVLYDEPADRFLILQMSTGSEGQYNSNSPAAILVAVSRGPDPVNDGWYTYRFNTGTTPDYPKISIWGDAYYVTSNKDSGQPQGEQVVFALERDRMLEGSDFARIIGFPLPGIITNGFYSPAGFNAVGNQLPPRGNAPIIYFQDDSWVAINQDHLKLWLINVNWFDVEMSSISLSQQITNGVSPFNSVFDGGDESNLSQPFDGNDIDALQGIVMYPTQYRRFSNYNSVVLNFVVDIDPSSGEHAAIRWYELRQQADGAPWQVYQEGTYAPDDSDRFCGSIGMDIRGNIALGYTILNDDPNNPIVPSLRYTGRFAGDPLGTMSIEEGVIADGITITPSSPTSGHRYGDYSHLAVDPSDGITYWFNGEIIDRPRRLNMVGVFQIGSRDQNDIGVADILSPESGNLGENEPVTVLLRNYGTNSQTGFEVTYSINGGDEVTEIFEDVIEGGASAEFMFDEPADLSDEGEIYTITVSVDLDGDENDQNDVLTEEVENLLPNDVGVVAINAPDASADLGPNEEVTVSIVNFGGSTQQNFQVSYQINSGNPVVETFNGSIEAGDAITYTFQQRADFSDQGRYVIEARTLLENDQNSDNDAYERVIYHLGCSPDESDCSLGDGITYFELNEIQNNTSCRSGYEEFLSMTATLDRNNPNYEVTVESSFLEDITADGAERFSMWIDLNDNSVFEPSEQVIDSEIIPAGNTRYTYDFQLPDDAPLGNHLLRVKASDVSYPQDSDNPDDFGVGLSQLNDPCADVLYGNTQDYTVLITDSDVQVGQDFIDDLEIEIFPVADNIYQVRIDSPTNAPLMLTVHNIAGQMMLTNRLSHNGEAYTYDLDMSYAATGVYLLRIGNNDYGKVKRFIVK